MVDEVFANSRLAALYDALDPDRSDLLHYVAIVDEFAATSVLDVGCGTGVFALMLADHGIEVTGVDPAAASLDVARAKPGAATVRWIYGDATTLPPLAVDLAVMTGNVAQVFLTDEAWTRNLHGIHGALAPGSRLVFEVRDPTRRGWEEWTREESISTTFIEGVGAVESWVELTDVSLPMVSFRHTYRFDGGEVLTSDSTLRFRERDEIEASLTAGGFSTREVRGAPDRPGREFVFIAQRTRRRSLWG